jgi:hypothetical protein
MFGALFLAAPGFAQEQTTPAIECEASDAALPADWSAWKDQTAVVAASDEAGLAGAGLTVGRGARAKLSSKVTWVAPPEKSPAPAGSGGLLALNIDQAGRYAIALGAGAWLDVVSGTAEQKTVGHGHGPDCSSIRKYVEYDLKPGRYVLQVSGNAASEIGVLVIRRP